ADMHRVSRGRPAGVGIGVATAIKLTPGIFIVLLLVTRRTKDALTAAGTFAFCTLLAHAIAPDASRLYWLHTFYDTSRVGVPYISNQSPLGALTRTLRGTAEVGDWYTAVPLIIGTAGIFLAAAWARRGDWLTAVAVTGTTGLLVSPISWAHHWVWIVPALAALIPDGHRTMATCGYLVFTLAPMWLTPYTATPLRPGWHLLLLPVANCYLLAGLFFLAHSFCLARPTRLRQGTSATTSEPSTRRNQPPRPRVPARLARTTALDGGLERPAGRGALGAEVPARPAVWRHARQERPYRSLPADPSGRPSVTSSSRRPSATGSAASTSRSPVRSRARAHHRPVYSPSQTQQPGNRRASSAAARSGSRSVTAHGVTAPPSRPGDRGRTRPPR